RGSAACAIFNFGVVEDDIVSQRKRISNHPIAKVYRSGIKIDLPFGSVKFSKVKIVVFELENLRLTPARFFGDVLKGTFAPECFTVGKFGTTPEINDAIGIIKIGLPFYYATRFHNFGSHQKRAIE